MKQEKYKMEMVAAITKLISNVVTFAGGLLLLFGAVTLALLSVY